MKAIPFNTGWTFLSRGSGGEPQPVTLPHDAMIHEQRLPDAPGGNGHGFFPGGDYLYQKVFFAPEEWSGKTVSVLFEGVYRNAVVSLNGRELARHAYGYTPFTVCLDGELLYGGENTLTVEADNSRLPNSRWYCGSGIYRPVCLLTAEKTHILWQGVKITTLSCDKYGVYLMDETFDMWYMAKTKYDYHLDFPEDWRADTRAIVERDYNHPSVLLYSIGNEISEPCEPKGVETARQIVGFIHSLDTSRAVTCGANLMIISRAAAGKGIYQDSDGNAEKQKSASKKEISGNASLMFNIMASFVGSGMNKAANSSKTDRLVTPFLDELDISGYNYASGRYKKDGKLHPQRLIFGSETFPQDIAKNWAMVKKLPHLAGDFMWAGWDYLGEAGIGAWSYSGGLPFARPYPWLLAGSGAIDINGVPDGSCRYAAAVWGKADGPALAVQPVNHPGQRPTKSVWRGTNAIESWAWAGCEGNAAVAEVYSDAAEAELFLNGKSLGRKKIKNYQARFKTRYQPGRLEAAVYGADGVELGRCALDSASGKLRIDAAPEQTALRVGGIAYIPITIRGENGVVESNADRTLAVSVDGGELLGFGSACPCSEQRFDAGVYDTYYGRALAVVRASAPGTLTVTARGEGLVGAVCRIAVTEE